MNWRIKGLVKKSLDFIPTGVRANRVLQGMFGALKNVEGEVDIKIVDDWMVFASHLNELGVNPEGLIFFEIGTGWYPTLPICFSLVGAKVVHTYDLSSHLDFDLTFRMLRRVEHHLPAMAVAIGKPLQVLRSRYAQLCQAQTLPELLARAAIDYHAPSDAARSGLPDDSVDLIFSNSVLEHIPSNLLPSIMQECHRVLRPTGYAIHSVCCTDHYYFFDKNISRINYIRYSSRHWRLWNNGINYQNRLRPRDFVNLSEAAGLVTVFRKSRPRPEVLEALPLMSIAPEFQHYPPEELASTSIDFAAKKGRIGLV
jgi:SAM-dependent methyltransferase